MKDLSGLFCETDDVRCLIVVSRDMFAMKKFVSLVCDSVVFIDYIASIVIIGFSSMINVLCTWIGIIFSYYFDIHIAKHVCHMINQ